MKIIDKTPLYKDGQLSFMDRAKAMLQFGAGWIHDVEAQKSVVNVLERSIDKSFTAIRNLVLPGLDLEIPIILVGPSGIYVIYVLSKTGTYRAKGDQWGSISAGAFREEKPNLLVRTERLSQVVQKYLKSHNRITALGAEAVMLCSNPATHVDSQRPIVRVVMRDALERFAVSISQGRIVLGPADVYDIINLLVNPKDKEGSQPDDLDEQGQKVSAEEEDPFAAYAPWGPPPESVTPEEQVEGQPEGQEDQAPPQFDNPPPFTSMDVNPLHVEPAVSESVTQVRKPRRGMSLVQWLLIGGMLLVWCLIVAAFVYFIWSQGLLP